MADTTVVCKFTPLEFKIVKAALLTYAQFIQVGIDDTADTDVAPTLVGTDPRRCLLLARHLLGELNPQGIGLVDLTTRGYRPT